jgi:hypothetical protein
MGKVIICAKANPPHAVGYALIPRVLTNSLGTDNDRQMDSDVKVRSE